MVQAAPGGLQLLEVLMVQDQVDLLGELLVDGADDGFDALVGIIAHGERAGERLLGQGLDGEVDGLAGLFGLGREFAADQRGEVGMVSARERLLLCWLGGGHGILA
ncbi:hypothetical protein D3C72_2103210 [compost metagenome]